MAKATPLAGQSSLKVLPMDFNATSRPLFFARRQ
jgi:hypothetical protein